MGYYINGSTLVVDSVDNDVHTIAEALADYAEELPEIPGLAEVVRQWQIDDPLTAPQIDPYTGKSLVPPPAPYPETPAFIELSNDALTDARIEGVLAVVQALGSAAAQQMARDLKPAGDLLDNFGKIYGVGTQIVQDLNTIATDMQDAGKRINLGTDVQQATVHTGQMFGTIAGIVFGKAVDAAVEEAVAGAMLDGNIPLAIMAPIIGAVVKTGGQAAATYAGSAGGWWVGYELKSIIDKANQPAFNPAPGVESDQTLVSIGGNSPGAAVLAAAGATNASTATGDPPIPPPGSTTPGDPSDPAHMLFLPLSATAGEGPYYIDAAGRLITTGSTNPVNPAAPIGEADFQIPSTGQYPVTTATLGADIADVYLHIMKTGNPGMVETLKLAEDMGVASQTMSFSYPLTITQISGAVGTILGGNGVAGTNLGALISGEITGVQPPAGIDPLTNYLNTMVFAPSDTPGSVESYLSGVAKGEASASAYSSGLSAYNAAKAPTVTISLAADTGVSAIDKLTNNPTLRGSGLPGALVTLTEAHGILGTTVADSAGNWSLRPILSDGAHTIVASEANAALNVGSASLTFTLDATPPALTASLVSDTGASSTDGLTSNAAIAGTADPNGTVTITDGGVNLATITADITGHWTWTPTLGFPPLQPKYVNFADGKHSLLVSESDLAGNVSTGQVTFTLDTTVPPTPPAPSYNTPSPGHVAAGPVTFFGTIPGVTNMDAGDIVTLSDDNGPIGTSPVTLVQVITPSRIDLVANWSVTGPLAAGAHGLTATATDLAGNVTFPSAQFTSVFANVPLPAPSAPAFASTGNPGYVNTGTTTIRGSAVTPGDTINLYEGQKLLGSMVTPTTNGGAWQIPVTWTDGMHSLSALEIALNGYLSAPSAQTSIGVDTVAPPAPSAPAYNGPASLAALGQNVPLSGTEAVAEAGDAVTLYWSYSSDGLGPLSGSMGPAIVQPDGSWSLNAAFSGYSTFFNPMAALPSSTPNATLYTLYASVTDLAGNKSPFSTNSSFTVYHVTAGLVQDTGKSATDGITSNPTLTGFADPNRLVTVIEGTNTLGAVMADASGKWSLTPAKLADGPHSLTAAEVGIQGGFNVAFTLKSSAPPPSTPTLDGGSDSGINGDNITDIATPTIKGSGEAGDAIKINDGSTTVGTGTVQPDGSWSITTARLSPGGHALTATETDAAGNSSSASSGLALNIASPPANDVNGDAKSDVFWRNSDGTVAIWEMNGSQILAGQNAGVIGRDWRIVGAPDLDGNGNADVLWRQTGTGAVSAWEMNGFNIVAGQSIGNVGPDWIVAGTPDLDADGHGDVLWRNPTSGLVSAWEMSGFNVKAAQNIGTVGPDWQVAGTGDVDGDGKGDVIWRNTATGTVAVWELNGFAVKTAQNVGTVGLDWSVAGTADFDGDGKTDILWRNTNTGAVSEWLLDGFQIKTASSVATVPLTLAVAGTPDTNGDGKADILWRQSDGTVEVSQMNGASVTRTDVVTTVGTNWNIVGQPAANGPAGGDAGVTMGAQTTVGGSSSATSSSLESSAAPQTSAVGHTTVAGSSNQDASANGSGTAAGGGSYTVPGGGSDTGGNMTVWGGAGVDGGAGKGGNATVTGFSQAGGNAISFPNETPAAVNQVITSARTANGSTMLTLPDGSNLTLAGVDQIDSRMFR